MHVCCFVVSFLLFLSNRCVYQQIGRAFEAPIGHKTLLCGHMVLLAPFVAYFLKKNYSRRQIILKNLRVWERSLISVSIGVYFGLIEVGTGLGQSVMEKGRTAAEHGPDARPNSLLGASGHSTYHVWSFGVQVNWRMNSTSSASGLHLTLRPIVKWCSSENDRTLRCVSRVRLDVSGPTGRVSRPLCS